MNAASSILISPNDPSLRSWVESANDSNGDFPLQNLPLGVVEDGPAVRIGEDRKSVV